MSQAKTDLEIEVRACQYLVQLLAALLHSETPAPLPEGLTWEDICREAARHKLDAMAFCAAQPQLDKQSELYKNWKFRRDWSLTQGLVQLGERDSIFAAFTAAGVRVLPVKGSVIKELYPQLDWRQMGDLDVLVDKENIPRAQEILRGMGYQVEEEHDTEYHCGCVKEPYMMVELHWNLLADSSVANDYFQNAWERAVPDKKNPLLYFLTPEDEYLYEIAHFQRHYVTHGSGIRSALDIAVYRARYEGKLDEAYISAELKKMHLDDFARCAERVAQHWFGTAEQRAKALDRDGREMEKALFYSGVYGSMYARAAIRLQETDSRSSRAKYVWQRIFVPCDGLACTYPILNKYPLLYPFCWLHRLVRLCLFGRKRIAAELEVFRDKNEEE